MFEGHLERLRRLIRKRTAVYAAEEKALRVMLEGEREEERKREQERKQRKEREKQLQRRREEECVLFGGTPCATVQMHLLGGHVASEITMFFKQLACEVLSKSLPGMESSLVGEGSVA